MKKFKYIQDKDPWMLAEHFPEVDFFFAQIWLSSFVNELKNSCGKNYKKVLAVFDPKFYIHFYYGQSDSLEFERCLVDKIKKNPGFGGAINKNIIIWSDRLRKFGDKLGKLDFKKLSNQKLSQLLKEQDAIHTGLYQWGWLSNATDMFHGSFTAELNKYLAEQINRHGHGENKAEIFNLLTSVVKKSVAAEQDESMLKIAWQIRNHGKKEMIEKMLDRHYERYFYLKYLWLGVNGLYSRSYFTMVAKKLAKTNISLKEKILAIDRGTVNIQKQKVKIYDDLKIDKKYQSIFSVYSDFMLTKIYRRYAQIFWAYQMGKLLKEVAKRLNLSLEETRQFAVTELLLGLRQGNINKNEAKKRSKFFWYYAEKGVDLISTDASNPILHQLKAKVDKNVKELTGQIGCLGNAIGQVKIVNSFKDMSKMKQGDILISIATNPDLVPAMKKAAAIVTEQGGVTSHAAIVSRELNIPCVIGTKIATKVFKDGDMVEVDATKGIVRKL